MGLDGISVNQLRIMQDNNSAEANRIARGNSNNEHKIVDGLANGQKVDPDKEKEKHQEQFHDFDLDADETENKSEIDVIKYDLSDSNKYILKVDSESNNILIIEKATSNVIQQIDADELSRYVGFLSSSQGSIVNRKF